MAGQPVAACSRRDLCLHLCLQLKLSAVRFLVLDEGDRLLDEQVPLAPVLVVHAWRNLDCSAAGASLRRWCSILHLRTNGVWYPPSARSYTLFSICVAVRGAGGHGASGLHPQGPGALPLQRFAVGDRGGTGGSDWPQPSLLEEEAKLRASWRPGCEETFFLSSNNSYVSAEATLSFRALGSTGADADAGAAKGDGGRAWRRRRLCAPAPPVRRLRGRQAPGAAAGAPALRPLFPFLFLPSTIDCLDLL